MKHLKAIVSVLLASLLLVASTGVVLQKHYCGGKLKEVSLYSKVKSCSERMEVKKPSCHKAMAQQPACHQPTTVNKEHNGCCENETEYQHSDDYTQPSQVSLDHTGPWVVLFAYTLPFDLFSVDSNPDSGTYLVHRPPDLSADITVSHQVFRL